MSHLISQAENGSPTLRRKSATQPSNLNANLIQKQPHRCMQKQCLAKHLSTPRPSQHITLATTDVNKYKIYLLKDIFHILWKILILYSFSKPILQNSQSFKNDLTCMCVHVCVCVCVCTHTCPYVLSCPSLFHMDSSLSGSSVHRTFQARILQWLAFSSSKGSS